MHSDNNYDYNRLIDKMKTIIPIDPIDRLSSQSTHLSNDSSTISGIVNQLGDKFYVTNQKIESELGIEDAIPNSQFTNHALPEKLLELKELHRSTINTKELMNARNDGYESLDRIKSLFYPPSDSVNLPSANCDEQKTLLELNKMQPDTSLIDSIVSITPLNPLKASDIVPQLTSETHSATQKVMQKMLNMQQDASLGGTNISTTPHKAFAAQDFVPNSYFEIIKKRILDSLPKDQWPQLKSGLDKNSKASLISKLANMVVNELRIISVNQDLALYNGIIWQYVDLPKFIQLIRERLWTQQEILDCLSYSNYRELMMKVKTTPSINVKAEEIALDTDLINFRDFVYDCRCGQFIDQSPNHYFFNYVDVSKRDIGQGSGIYFEKFLETSSGGDRAVCALILEMIGAVISSVMLKGFFLLLGPANSGKTQLGLLIESLLGKEQVAVIPTLNALKKPHTTAILKGKKACLCMDLPRSYIDEESLSIIKQITGKDPISIEQKYHDMERYDNTAKLILAANLLPPVNDPIRNDAYFDRMKIVPFKHAIPPERRIPDLADKMAAERGYIIGKVLPVLQDLRRNNFNFTEVDIDIDEFGTLKTTGKNLVGEFFEECCITDTDSKSFTEDIYSAYQVFCKKNMQQPKTKIAFSQEFSKYVKHLEKLHTTRNGTTANGYRGLGIKEEYKNE